jgi:Spy/CpxP family protein refolding chaperone
MKHYLIIAIFSLIAIAGTAQSTEKRDGKNGEAKMEERIQKMKTELSLTADQESKLRDAMTIQMNDLKTEKMKIREAENSMREINKKYHDSLPGFMSEEQITKMKSLKPSAADREAREKGKGGKKGKK